MGWMPCSGLETVDDLVWVKRMVQKARRLQESRAAAAGLMNGYLFGENDFLDGWLLRFLRLRAKTVSEIVAQQADDERAARAVIERSGRTREECRAFSKRLRLLNANFALIEADEERLPPGFLSTGIRALYRGLVMPPVYAIFRLMEWVRPGTGSSTGSG